MTTTVYVKNCYDCPFWHDGCNEFGERCLAPFTKYDDEYPEVLESEMRYRDLEMPKKCPLRKRNIKVMMKE